MQAENDLTEKKEHGMNICNERWLAILEKTQRPVARWLMALLCIGYGFRAVIGYDVEELLWGAYAVAAGFTYWRRGDEKLKEMEIER